MKRSSPESNNNNSNSNNKDNDSSPRSEHIQEEQKKAYEEDIRDIKLALEASEQNVLSPSHKKTKKEDIPKEEEDDDDDSEELKKKWLKSTDQKHPRIGDLFQATSLPMPDVNRSPKKRTNGKQKGSNGLE